jgi:NADPH:quinone reductase-like Zn-dependent oxidoreductase
MRAVARTQYGSPDVLQLVETAVPDPKDDELLLKVLATSVNAADWHLLRGDPFLVRLVSGLFTPKTSILGADICGRVEAVGKDVKTFKVGDEVFGDNSSSGFGGFAEFACVKAQLFSLKPTALTFEEAAAVPMASVTALQGLRQGQIKKGSHVLIHGASGGVGTFAVQIAKSYGAEVTALCGSNKLQFMQALGADHVIDYSQQDFAQLGSVFDLILAANGDRSIFDYRKVLSPSGCCVVSGGSMRQLMSSMLVGPWLSLGALKKLSSLQASPNLTDLTAIKALLESGQVKPVLDRTFP